MATRKREIKTIFSLDGEQKYRDAIRSINREQALLRSELRAAQNQFDASGDAQQKLTTKAESLSKQIDLQKKKIQEAQHAVEQSTKIYGENSKETMNYKIELANAESQLGKLQTQLYKTNKELLENESSLKKAGEAAERAGDKLKNVGDKMQSVGNKMTLGVTAPIMAAAGYSSKAAMDFESAFAGVRKTVDATEEKFAELEQGVRDMAKEIPASAVEIANVAESAGQLGIQTDNILDFSKAMIDLGEATNLSANEAASSLAQFANITQMSQKDFSNLGSTIVALGNNLATTEKDIVNMGQRLAGAGKQIGLSEAEIMSFAASLSSVGIEAQAGGSAFSKVMIEMQLAVETNSEKLKDYAKVAGMSAKDFSKAFKEDAAGALISFIDGLGSAEKRGLSTIKVLDDMGITEVRLRDTLLRAAGASNVFTGAIELGTKAWKENNALTQEAEQRYKTTESQLKIAKNTINDAAITIGQNLLPPLADLAKSVAGAAEAFGEMSPEMQKTALVALGVLAAVGPTAKTIGTLTSAVGGASKAIGNFTQKLADKKIAQEAAAQAAQGLAGVSENLGAVLGPAGLSLAVAAAVGVIGGLVVAMEESERASREAGKAAVSFVDSVSEWESGVATAKSALEGFNTETIISKEKMQELEQGIDDAQQSILGIAELAAAESRKYTEEERKQIEELVGLIADYSKQKLEAYQQQARIMAALAEQESYISSERAQELIKGAEDAKNQTIAIADAQYKETISLAMRTYGEKGELDKEAYNKALKDAKEAYNEQKKIAQSTYAETLEIVRGHYFDSNAEAKRHLKDIEQYNAELKRLEEDKNKKLKEIRENDALNVQQISKGVYDIEKEYKEKRDELLRGLEEAYLGAQDTQAGAWAAMVRSTIENGGKIDKETQSLIEALTESFDHLPLKVQETTQEFVNSFVGTLQDSEPRWCDAAMLAAKRGMEGFQKGLESKEKDINKAADKIFKGVLDRGNLILEIKSPSRALKRMGEYAMEGLEAPFDEAEKDIPEKMQKITKGVLEEARALAEAQAYLSERVASDAIVGHLGAATQVPSYPVPETKSGATIEKAEPAIVIQNMQVRDESDIQKIAVELDRLKARRARGRGYDIQ